MENRDIVYGTLNCEGETKEYTFWYKWMYQDMYVESKYRPMLLNNFSPYRICWTSNIGYGGQALPLYQIVSSVQQINNSGGAVSFKGFRNSFADQAVIPNVKKAAVYSASIYSAYLTVSASNFSKCEYKDMSYSYKMDYGDGNYRPLPGFGDAITSTSGFNNEKVFESKGKIIVDGAAKYTNYGLYTCRGVNLFEYDEPRLKILATPRSSSIAKAIWVINKREVTQTSANDNTDLPYYLQGSYLVINPNWVKTLEEDLYIEARITSLPTITYNTDGGSEVPSYKSEGEITLAGAPTRQGRDFVGWKIGNTIYNAGATYNLTSNVTAIAIWTNISFKNNDPTIGKLKITEISPRNVVEQVIEEDATDNYVKVYGKSGYAYQLDCTINDDSSTYKAKGVFVDGEWVASYRFKNDGSDVTGEYFYEEKKKFTCKFIENTVAAEADFYGEEAGQDSNGNSLYYEGTEISIFTTINKGWKWVQTAIKNVDTNDVYYLQYDPHTAFEWDDGRLELWFSFNLLFNAQIIIDYASNKYRINTGIMPDCESAISAVAAIKNGQPITEGDYQEQFNLTATLMSEYQFCAWYEIAGNGLETTQKRIGTVNPLSRTVESYNNESDAKTYKASAKVSVTVELEYPAGTAQNAKTCSLELKRDVWADSKATGYTTTQTVNGSTFEVELGRKFDYKVILGDRVPGTKWKFDCLFDTLATSESAKYLPFSQEGSIKPTRNLVLKAKVAESITRILKIYVVKVSYGSEVSEYVEPNEWENWVSVTEVSEYVKPPGSMGLLGVEPFKKYTTESTKYVKITAPGSLVHLNFYGYTNSKTSSLYPLPNDIVCSQADYTLLLSKETTDVYIYYGAPSMVNAIVAYASLSTSSMGSIEILSIDDDSDEAMIFEDRKSCFLTQMKHMTVIAIPYSGYEFVGWFKDKTAIGTPLYDDNCATIEIKAESTFYAKFKKSVAGIYQWEGGRQNKTMTWRSKTYESSKPFNPSACRVDALGYSGDNKNSQLKLTVDMFSAPNSEYANSGGSRVVIGNIKSQNARRLPVCRPERYMQVEVTSNVEVDSVSISTSMRDL